MLDRQGEPMRRAGHQGVRCRPVGACTVIVVRVGAKVLMRWKLEQDLLRGVSNPMSEFKFEPIKVNSTAPGGACVLRTFDDVGAFVLLNVGISRKSQCWQAVRQDLSQARFGARRAEVYRAVHDALAEEGWLAD
jgi:hypothetical protein